MVICTSKLTVKALAPLTSPQALSDMIQNLVKETNFKLQRGKLQRTLGDWSRWSGSTNLTTVRITDSMCLLKLKLLQTTKEEKSHSHF